MATVDWDQNEYDEGRAGFETLPKGRYGARVTGVEKKDTKRKDGYLFEIELSLEGDAAKNRKVWARLNVSNPSDVAQRIGREQWNALCVAAGFAIGAVKDTRNIVGKRVIALVDIEKRDDGSTTNKVTGFFPHDGSAPAAPRGSETGRTSGAAPQASNKPKGADDFDDDIPFIRNECYYSETNNAMRRRARHVRK